MPNWLGDVVMALPFLDALRAAYPPASIHVVVKKELRDIVALHKEVAEIHPFSKASHPGLMGVRAFGKALASAHAFDIYFCLPNSFSSAAMGYFANCKTRVGYLGQFRGVMLTHGYHENTKLHRAECYLNLLEQFSGKSIAEKSIRLQPDHAVNMELPNGKLLVFNVNSEAQSRRIPIGTAQRLLEAIRQNFDFQIILTGGPKDVGYVSEILRGLSSLDRIHDFSGKTSLPELWHLVQRADLVLSTDSGIAHVANAFQRKTIVLFGAGNENQTRPFNAEGLVIIRQPGLSCAPCVSNKCKFGEPKCLTGLEVMSVLEGIRTLGF